MSKGLFKYIKDVEIDFENQYDHFVNIYDHFAINKLLKLTKPLILSHTRLYKLPHACDYNNVSSYNGEFW